MTDAYAFLYNGTQIVIGVLLLFCLIRAIRGPRIADRVISINMMGTLIVITICVLAFLMNEGYLVDIAMIYTMLSFLAVVLLTKIYMGVYREKRRRREAAADQLRGQMPRLLKHAAPRPQQQWRRSGSRCRRRPGASGPRRP